jgi:dipeptidyl aminopeptidase/acylaminoacyl peptidase
LPEVYAQASPTTFVDSQDPPVFLFHGKNDRIVPMTSAAEMKQRLDLSGVPATLHVVEDASHFGAFVDRDARERSIRFLDEQLAAARDE